VQFLSNKWHGQGTLFASEYSLCERRWFLFFSSFAIATAMAAAVAAAVAAAAAVANGEGRTHGVDWNDGSLYSMGRSDPVLSGPREDNVSSSPREIRREGRKTARVVGRNEEKRLGCEVNVSPKVSFCQVRPV